MINRDVIDRKALPLLVCCVVVGVIALLLLLARESPKPVTFSFLKTLSAENMTNVAFRLKGSRLFFVDGKSGSVEAITSRGITNYAFSQHVDKNGINVFIPRETTTFRVKQGYLEPTALARARLSLTGDHPDALWLYRALDILRPLERPPKYKEVWSPWLVKTNGMWVEQPER